MYAFTHSAKDFKNRELFEKLFPELKARREQQERFTRYVHLYIYVHVPHTHNTVGQVLVVWFNDCVFGLSG